MEREEREESRENDRLKTDVSSLMSFETLASTSTEVVLIAFVKRTLLLVKF